MCHQCAREIHFIIYLCFLSWILKQAGRLVPACWSGESRAVLLVDEVHFHLLTSAILHELQKTLRKNMWTVGRQVLFGLSCFRPLWYPAIEFPRLTCINQLTEYPCPPLWLERSFREIILHWAVGVTAMCFLCFTVARKLTVLTRIHHYMLEKCTCKYSEYAPEKSLL